MAQVFGHMAYVPIFWMTIFPESLANFSWDHRRRDDTRVRVQYSHQEKWHRLVIWQAISSRATGSV